ncbi:MAG: hypothetical protein WCP82_09605 [Alphaproteobacteria bacterium]
MIDITFSCASARELREQLLDFAQALSGDVRTIVPDNWEPAPNAEPMVNPAPKTKAKPKLEAEPLVEPEVERVIVPLDTAPSYEVVRGAVLMLADARGKAATVALLQSFGATRASDIDPLRWAEVVAAADALRAEAE